MREECKSTGGGVPDLAPGSALHQTGTQAGGQLQVPHQPAS